MTMNSNNNSNNYRNYKNTVNDNHINNNNIPIIVFNGHNFNFDITYQY